MFYFNSYKTEMELVTPLDLEGEGELIKGRVVFLKVPDWMVYVYGSAIIFLTISFAALVSFWFNSGGMG